MPTSQFRVLIVEAERGIANLFRGFLERRGCQVIVAADGRTALELATGQSPDLVLLDLELADAATLARQLLASSSKGRRPARVVVVSDRPHDDVVARAAARAGVQIFLRKPIDFALLDTLLVALWPRSA